MKKICADCKGTNLQVRAWVNVNTLEFVEYTPEDDIWCETCGTFKDILTVDDDLNQLKLDL